MKYLIYILSALAFSVTAQAANLTETAQWENGIYRIELSDPVEGGENGIDNRQAKQLGNRTLFLKQSIDTVNSNVVSNTSDITSLRTNQNLNTSNISANAYSLTQLNGRIDATNAKVAVNESSLTIQQSVDNNLSDLINQLQSRITVLENQIPTAQNFEAIKVGQVVEFDRHFNTAAAVATHMGYGTWQRFSEGRVTVGYDSSSSAASALKTVGSTFGASQRTLSSSNIPKHSHELPLVNTAHSLDKFDDANMRKVPVKYVLADDGDTNDNYVMKPSADWGHYGGNSSGQTVPFDITQPSITVDKWLRVS